MSPNYKLALPYFLPSPKENKIHIDENDEIKSYMFSKIMYSLQYLVWIAQCIRVSLVLKLEKGKLYIGPNHK